MLLVCNSNKMLGKRCFKCNKFKRLSLSNNFKSNIVITNNIFRLILSLNIILYKWMLAQTNSEKKIFFFEDATVKYHAFKKICNYI